MRKKVLQHFKKSDPILYSVIEKIETADIFTSDVSPNLFLRLCRAIIGQQLSGKAADTIFARFLKLFPHEDVNPVRVLALTDQDLRNVGMSWSKAKFLKDLSQRIVDKTLDLEKIKTMEDEHVIAELTKVKGIGPWTAEMFLMFALDRPDVFSHGDLGLRKAIEKLYRFKKAPSKKQIEKIATKWIPYRTYASRILWKSLEV